MTRLADLTWPEVADRSTNGAVLLVPLGSTEQHGPHLPLSTDTDIAVAIATTAADRIPGAVVAPPLPFGSSGEHQGFPGTLSIGAAATESVVLELGRSADDFASVVLVSTHGGNADPVARAVATLSGEGRSVRAWGPRWDGDAHAGHLETSLMLVIAPHLVRLEAAEAGDLRPVAELLPELRDRGVAAVSPNGVLGDPAGSSPQDGRRLLATAVDQLVTFVVGERPVETVRWDPMSEEHR